MLLDADVQEIGDPTQCHAVAIDARAPQYDGGIITRLDCVVFGIVVNKHSERFYDEGEDIWPKRYAIWGRLVAQQPDGALMEQIMLARSGAGPGLAAGGRSLPGLLMNTLELS